mgnify:CR=1 FL=1
MKYGICDLSVVPLRADAKDQAEIVSQLLLGDLVEILKTADNWILVRCLFDDYQGWMDTKQITALSQIEFDQLQSTPHVYIYTHLAKINRTG